MLQELGGPPKVPSNMQNVIMHTRNDLERGQGLYNQVGLGCSVGEEHVNADLQQIVVIVQSQHGRSLEQILVVLS